MRQSQTKRLRRESDPLDDGAGKLALPGDGSQVAPVRQ